MNQFISNAGSLSIPLVFFGLISFSLILHLSTYLFLVYYNIHFKNLFNKLQLNSFDKKKFEDYFDSFISKYERRINWLSNIASLSTMTGLLGTVIGISVAFDKMKQNGVASAEIFADGIGIALITTILGLSIALPSLFFYYVFNHFVEVIFEKALDKLKINERN